MQVTISTRNLRMPVRTEKLLDRKVARLRKRLIHFNPALVEISVVLEKLGQKNEFRSTLTCRLPVRTLRVVETEDDETRSVNRAFDVLERQIEKVYAHLRGEGSRSREE